MNYRSRNTHINSGTKVSTVCKNLVKIGSVTSEFKKRVCVIFAVTGPQFDDRRPFGTLAFQNRLEDWNFYFRRVIGNGRCTSFLSCRNLVRFGSMAPVFKT